MHEVTNGSVTMLQCYNVTMLQDTICHFYLVQTLCKFLNNNLIIL